MSGFVATFVRELRAYFVSPLAYVLLTFVLLLNGAHFWLIVSVLNDPRAGAVEPLQLFFGGTFLFWLILLLVTPVLTMRLISEELRSGTIESLMTAPVSETAVVLGKYLASLVLFAFLWLPTLIYVVLIDRSSDVDWGPVAAGYLGILGVGAAFLALGIFASSFTKNQIVAGLATFALVIFFFAIAFVDTLVTGEALKEVLAHVNLLAHLEDFTKGIVDTRHLVYYLSTAALFLFLTSRALAAKKWR